MNKGPVRILIVEDQYFARIALHTVIEGRDDMKIVAETGNGTQVLPLFKEHRPDITIMDLRLPGMSGFDAIRAVRAEDPSAGIVVLSNYDGSEDVHRALASGVLAYLTKDAGADELIEAIQSVAAGKRYLPPAVCALISERIGSVELTERENEVLRCLARGHSNKEIADILGIADKTVRIHVSHILDKLGVADRTQATIAAIQRGIVHLD